MAALCLSMVDQSTIGVVHTVTYVLSLGWHPHTQTQSKNDGDSCHEVSGRAAVFSWDHHHMDT